MTSKTPVGLSRRTVMVAGGLGALTGTSILPSPHASAAPDDATVSTTKAGSQLRFRPDGRFKILQINDTQDDHRTDRRTVELIERMLDDERPDLVINNGDTITGGPQSERQVRQALHNVSLPMEARRIPWAITLGNHDADSAELTGMDNAAILDVLDGYEYNLNHHRSPALPGTANTRLLIAHPDEAPPAYAVWLIDSGRYAPERIADQPIAPGYPTWDWVRMPTVNWYSEQSRGDEAQFGQKLPGLMFMHIPLWEHRFMWFGSVDGRSAVDADRGRQRHSIVGERNEAESPGPFNSGMFSALHDRGDVDGVYCGHDHVNTYTGNYYGVHLGFGPGTGFRPYGLDGEERHHLRGGRVFELSLSDQGTRRDTWLKFAREDYHLDMGLDHQPMEPFLLPTEIGSQATQLQVHAEATSVGAGDTVPITATVLGAHSVEVTGWAVCFVDGVPDSRADIEAGRVTFDVTVPADVGGELAVEVSYGGDGDHAPAKGTTVLKVH